MRRSRPPSWVMVGSSTSRVSWVVTPKPSAKDSRNWRGRTTWTLGASEKRGRAETVDRDRLDAQRELLEGASGPHRGRSDANRGEVDELVAAADREANEGHGHCCQSRRRLS